jgi:YesN/AraC family two-component response regulator
MSAFKENYEPAWSEDSTRLICTPTAFAKSNLFFVQEVGYFRTIKPYFTEREKLSSYLMVYTLSGEGRLNYKGKIYTLKAQDLFFIDCMEYQHYKTASEAPWEMLWVHFKGNATAAYYHQFAEKGEPLIQIPHYSGIPSIIRQLMQLHKSKSVRTELISSKLLVELLTELLLTAQELNLLEAKAPDYIEAMMLQISQHYRKKITLDDLAKQFAVSKYHMSKEFKLYTGFSPNEYLINTRINHAKELLKYSDHSVAEIAAEVGVDNVSHFINLFKDRVEHTPLAYRQLWAN